MSTRPDVVIATETWDGLGLAMLMERQGTNVLMAYQHKELEDKKDKAAADQCGDGLVERMPLERAMKLYTGGDALWQFDNNALPEEADALRKKGATVIGTSAFSAKLEKDRDYAAELAEDVGLAVPETEEFSDTEAAIAYLEKHPDTAYVCKAEGGDADQTFVPLPSDPDAVANEMVRGYLAALEEADQKDRAKTFILQERISGGLELNVEVWAHQGKALVAFVDLESKRRLTGDLGELVGCSQDLVFQIPTTAPLVKRVLSPYLKRREFKDYVGSLDANVIVKGGKFYFLEHCCRWGFNSTPTTFYGLGRVPMADALTAWVKGEDCRRAFTHQYATSLSLFASEHESGFPVIVPRQTLESFCPYALRAAEDGSFGMVGGGRAWYSVGALVAAAPQARAAAKRCLDLAAGVTYPNKGFRTDGTDTDVSTLPLARLRKLQTMGLLGGTV